MTRQLIKRLIVATALCGAMGTAASAENLRFTVWTGSQAQHGKVLQQLAANGTRADHEPLLRLHLLDKLLAKHSNQRIIARANLQRGGGGGGGSLSVSG